MRCVDSRTSPRLRVLIADDHPSVRKGLQALLELEADLEVVGTARNGLQALEIADELNPDIILMDLSMPYMDGLEAARCLRRRKPNLPIIGLATRCDARCQEQAERAGIAALVEVGAQDGRLSQVIRSLCRARYAQVPDADGSA